jgi:hypothetical protein
LRTIARTVSFLILVRFLPSCSTRLAMSSRSLFVALLFFVLVSSMFISVRPEPVSAQTGQTSQITEVRNSLLSAFQAVRAAEQDGASNQSLAPLISELNQALGYELLAENGSSTAAFQSIELSNDVSIKAQALASQAQTASQDRTILAYAIAVALALGSSILVLEVGRLQRFLRKRRILRSRIKLGDSNIVA